MNIDELEEMATKDMKIDKSELAIAALRVPMIHHKYLKIQNSEVFLLKKCMFEYDTLYKERVQFYTGKADPEVYKEEPFDITVLRADVDMYIRADKKIQAMKSRIILQEQKVEYLKQLIIELGKRNWAIKNAIDFIKYQHGQ
jgi:hypothetical protein